jgi:hypothetical protein
MTSAAVSALAGATGKSLTLYRLGSYSYDANGNILSGLFGKTIHWDFENRLVSATVPNVGTRPSATIQWEDAFKSPGPLGTTNFLYQGPNVLEQVDNAINVSGDICKASVLTTLRPASIRSEQLLPSSNNPKR